jgi:hypothetical protein
LQALADIKPEVEATIKMGRRLVETKAVLDPPTTSKNIDSLKELFNLLGSQVCLVFTFFRTVVFITGML